MANWSLPTLTSTYTDVLNILKDRDVDAATLFVSAPTNPVSGMFRFNRGSNLFEEWNGSSWVAKVLALAGGGTGATDAAGVRTNLGLGSLATQNSNAVSITGGAISGLASLGVSGTVTAGLFSGSGASLTSIPNSATTATNLNTPSAIVARDASGNFSAGTISANITGNAGTVTNGLYSTGSYSDPAWLTSLSGAKISGTVANATTAVNFTGSLSGEVTGTQGATTIPSLNASKLTGTIADARLSSNVMLKDGNGFITLSTQPHGRMYRYGAVTIGNASETTIFFNTNEYRTPASDWFPVNATPCLELYRTGPGVYLVTAHVTWFAGGGSVRRLKLQDYNGLLLASAEAVPSATQFTTQTVTTLVKVTTSSYDAATLIRCMVYQDSGGNLDIAGYDRGNTWLSAVKLW